jgi:NAD(P)-dependent dehydrogenase (short-subunit alcohol dehydrogenase family)
LLSAHALGRTWIRSSRKLGHKGLDLVLDLCQPSQFDGLVVEVKRAFGHIDVIVSDGVMSCLR